MPEKWNGSSMGENLETRIGLVWGKTWKPELTWYGGKPGNQIEPKNCDGMDLVLYFCGSDSVG